MKDLALTRSAGMALPGIFDPMAVSVPVRRMTRAFALWNQRRITRRELETLSDRELTDIGLTRNQIGRVVEDMY